MKIYSVRPFHCPFCGERADQNLKIQTPICDDGIHHDAYMRCFTCGARGPYFDINLTPAQIGSMPVAPVIELWNKRIGLAMVSQDASCAYTDVIAERNRQDQQWDGPEHDDDHTSYDWSAFIHHHTAKLHLLRREHGRLRGEPHEWVESDGPAPDYRERLVKIAALAVAAIESYDRRKAAFAEYVKPCLCCGSSLGCYCHEHPHPDKPECPGNYEPT